MIELRIVLVLVVFCQLDTNVVISGRGNITGILATWWPNIQLESGISSRGRVYIQLGGDRT